MSIESKALDWIRCGETGMSSESILWVLLGKQSRYAAHPHDPSDFRRCLLLLDTIPELKEKFYLMRETTPKWKRLVDRWDELKAVFFTECDQNNKYKFFKAPKTYKLMREILEDD